MGGLVHIYTGNGKGKTTAAVGLAVRAWGRGMKILMVQFLKGRDTGEINTLKKLGENIEVLRSKHTDKFSWNMNERELEELKREAAGLFKKAVEAVAGGRKNMLILDEIMASVTSGFIPVEEVSGFLKNKPPELEVVMTGRNAPEELLQAADYVSEIVAVKHPFQKGVPAREGIEF